ncbi:hypothetical protein G6F43_008153 [Rhizopus delemar]|nr:hypothetical protein G6F43_008153 [Rhizopus delemar]
MIQANEKSAEADASHPVDSSDLDAIRGCHNEKDVTYWLPKDEKEQERLKVQHFAIKELYEGNVLSSVRNTLDFEKGLSVLDVGCGAGAWIMDMKEEYPECIFDGCDIVDAVDEAAKLNEFTFNYGNVVQGLPYADNTFDLVHIRFLVLALREDQWPMAIQELVRVTKPGGMIQLTELDLHPLNTDCEPFVVVESAVHEVCKKKGQNPRIALEIERMLLETERVKVIQTDYRSCDMSSDTDTARKFRWDYFETLKTIMPTLKPWLGLESDEEVARLVDSYGHCLATRECHIRINAVAAQKL